MAISQLSAEQHIEQANLLLENALEETQRSSADVVTHLICSNSRKSIQLYLQAYLLKHKTEPHPSGAIESLFEQCTEIDPAFDNIKIEVIQCKYEGPQVEYCLGIDQVDECLEVAKELRSLVSANQV